MDIHVCSDGTLQFNGKTYRCALGKNGVSKTKKEGDLATPVGSFALRSCYYRADKYPPPKTILTLHTITRSDGWCDDPAHPLYNQPVMLPFPASHERLYRDDDGVYDVIVPLGYNDNPVVPGKGSAIFLHVTRPDYSGTEGCVALALPDLLHVLSEVTKDTRLIVSN